MPKNDTTRLIVYAVCFLTIVISAVLLKLVGNVEIRDTLQWVTIVVGLLGSGLAGLKLNQDRRGSGPSEPEQ
ncbi:hypothetical protein [Mycobacteroides salmoniphilum]|uniref:hypothetical protein n=1 Tax=Mycobacteroides salmoniphilum TaxID=404941 RepID=UPI0009942138|nr:hypothetical protein [Mycobacteroides salmoniphilum]